MCIRDSAHSGKCSVCLEEKQIINNFYCECAETTCRECNISIDYCPICKSGKYYQLERKHIFMLLDALVDNSARAIIKTWVQIIKEINPKVNDKFTLYQMYAKTSDIDFCVHSKYPNLESVASSRCQVFNSIYCLSLFPWKMEIPAIHYVVCYKGLDRPSTYSECKKSRTRMDCLGLYATNII